MAFSLHRRGRVRIEIALTATLSLLAGCLDVGEVDGLDELGAPGADVEIALSPSTDAGELSAHLFGTNLLYWVDDDAALADGTMIAAMQAAGIGMLRFPGGTVANNYDWTTNQLEDPLAFPYSAAPEQDAVTRTDTFEFLDVVDQLPGAGANLVVNIEGAYLREPFDRASSLQRAADWVFAVNIDRQAGVRYWEIGNEEYHARLPGLTAHEYAAEVVAYAAAMKAVDPSIKIGAVGPFGAHDPGFADTLTAEGLAVFRSMSKSEIDARKDELGGQPELASWLNGGIAVRGEPWWKVLAREAGGSFDFIVVHRYDPTRNQGDFAAPVSIAQTIGEIREVVRADTSGAFEVAMTEWNAAGDIDLGPDQHVVVMAEQLTHLMRSRVAFGNFWPLRLDGSKFSLMEPDRTAKDQLAVFGAIATSTNPSLIPSEVTRGEQVDVVATARWGSDTAEPRRTVVIVNRARVTRDASVSQLPGRITRARQFFAPEGSQGMKTAVLSPANPQQTDAFYIKLRPLSITILETEGND